MRVSKLIKLWVSEGFLKQSVSNKSLEETAEDYLVGLVKRNLVLMTKGKSNGKIKSLSLHDMMREMCIKKGKNRISFSMFSHLRRVSVIKCDLISYMAQLFIL